MAITIWCRSRRRLDRGLSLLRMPHFGASSTASTAAEADAAWRLLTSAEDLPAVGVRFQGPDAAAPVLLQRDDAGRLVPTPLS